MPYEYLNAVFQKTKTTPPQRATMNKFNTQNNHWKEDKALGFFLNFINNHKEPVNDCDSFALIASLKSKEEWIDSVSSRAAS